MRPIPQGIFPQRDFSGGQIDESAMRRDDLNIVLAAMRKGENLQIGPAGNATRRPGSWHAYETMARTEQFAPYPDRKFDCLFYPDSFRAFWLDGSGTVQTITGTPWNTAADIADMEIEEVDNTIVVAHQDWPPHVLAYNRTADTWSIAEFAFRSDPNGTSRELFHRFGNEGTTMKPSAYEGAITVEFSQDTLLPGHVGVIFRYGDRQMRIDSVIDDQLATATVLEPLSKTHRVPVESSESYAVGEVVEGTDSGLSGIISRIEGDVLYIVAYKTDGEQFNGDDLIVGPRARNATIDPVGASAQARPDAMIVWDEQFMSAVRGWPGSVTYLHSRLTFCRFVQEGRAFGMSAPGVPEDFKETGQPDGAIFEFAPSGTEVRYIEVGGDVFLLLNDSVYSIPVSSSSPLAPGSVEFRYVGEIGAALVRPEMTNEGLVYISADAKRVMAIVPTGQATTPYVLENVARYHSHLIKTPIALASSRGNDNAPGDYIYVVNADGTLSVGRYDPVNKWIGFVPWPWSGSVIGASSRQDDLCLAVTRTIDGDERFFIEKLSDEVFLDGAVLLATAGADLPLTTEAGAPITTEALDPITVGLVAFEPYGGGTVSVQSGNQYLGLYSLDVDGVMIDPPFDYPEAYFGFAFPLVFQPIVPNFGGGSSQHQRLRRRKIATAMITVRGTTGFQLGTRLIAHWEAGENQEEPPPARNASYKTRPLGRSYDPTIEVRQDVPGPFDMIEFCIEAGA